MLTELQQAPDTVAQLLASDADTWQALARQLRQQPPAAVLTLARGSSDHAAHFLAYLAMARLGRLVTSLPMSLVTLHASRLQCAGLLSLAFSQSGQSPDLVLPTQAFRQQGARTVALVNDAGSPLAQASEWVLPLHAGAERSVAATKSCIAQLVAGARLVAHWQDDAPLHAALQALPDALHQALGCDWGAAVPLLAPVDRMVVIGRGLGLAVALEAALKLKETCGIQAEAFSGAEFRHGPMALVQQGYPLLVLAPRGPAQAGLLDLARELRALGAQVLLAAPMGTPGAQLSLAAPGGTPGAQLPLAPAGHEDLDAISTLQSFYLMVEALARARGRDPDTSRHLSKVTRTH